MMSNGWNPDTFGGWEKTLITMESWIGKQLSTEFGKSFGIDNLDADFFTKILPEGSENLLDSFVRFGIVMDKTDDAVAAFTRQLETTKDAATAFLNMETILTTVKAIDALLDPLLKITDPLVTIVDQFNKWDDILKKANASLEDITMAEEKRTMALGLQLTGLSAGSVGSSISGAITGQTEIGDAINGIIGQSIASNLATALTNDVMDTAINPFIKEVGDAFEASGNDVATVFAMMPELMAKLNITDITAATEQAAELWDTLYGTKAIDKAKKDAEDAAAKAEKITQERLSLEREWLELTNNTVELRKLDLEGLDESNRATQIGIWAYEDNALAIENAAKAAEDLSNIMKLRAEQDKEYGNTIESLQVRMMQAKGDTAGVKAYNRGKEFDELDSLYGGVGNRTLAENLKVLWAKASLYAVHAAEDVAEAAEIAFKEAEDAARIAKQIMDERLGLEKELLTLQGDTAALRALA